MIESSMDQRYYRKLDLCTKYQEVTISVHFDIYDEGITIKGHNDNPVALCDAINVIRSVKIQGQFNLILTYLICEIYDDESKYIFDQPFLHKAEIKRDNDDHIRVVYVKHPEVDKKGEW